jgi:hypothetical protein
MLNILDILLCLKAGVSQQAALGGFLLLTGNTADFTSSASMFLPDLPSLRKPKSVSVSKKDYT